MATIASSAINVAPSVDAGATAAVTAASTTVTAALSCIDNAQNKVVEFISNNLCCVRFLEAKAGETMMNIVKLVGTVFSSLLLLPLASIGWACKQATSCCTSTSSAASTAATAAVTNAASTVLDAVSAATDAVSAATDAASQA